MRLIVFFTSSTFVCLFQRDRKKNHKGKYTIMVVSTYSFMFLLFQFSIYGVFYEVGRRGARLENKYFKKFILRNYVYSA